MLPKTTTVHFIKLSCDPLYAGLILQNGTCIPVSQCPCVYHGMSYGQGQVLQQGCSIWWAGTCVSYWSCGTHANSLRLSFPVCAWGECGTAPRITARVGLPSLNIQDADVKDLRRCVLLSLHSRMFRRRRRVRDHVRWQDVPPAGGVSVRAGKESRQQQIHGHTAVHNLCRGSTHCFLHTHIV